MLQNPFFARAPEGALRPAHQRAASFSRVTLRSRRESVLLALLSLTFFCALQLMLRGLAHAEGLSVTVEQTPPPASPATSPTEVASPDAPGSAYSRSIDAALLEYDRGNFEEAREHLRSAHEVYPNARTFRGLGKAEFELRNYGESVKMLEAALSSTIKPLDENLRGEVEDILVRARAYVGEVHVDVEPGTATVSVDGVPVAIGPDAALALVVGDHVLEFRASGHLPERRAIRVKGGERLTVRVVLPAPNEREAGTAQVPVNGGSREDGSTRKRRWLLGGLGAVIVGGIVTGVVLATRPQDERTGDITGGTTGVVIANP